jgi:hypothetical protein
MSRNRQTVRTILQVENTRLAHILDLGTRWTHFRLLVSGIRARAPTENHKRSLADLNTASANQGNRIETVDMSKLETNRRVDVVKKPWRYLARLAMRFTSLEEDNIQGMCKTASIPSTVKHVSRKTTVVVPCERKDSVLGMFRTESGILLPRSPRPPRLAATSTSRFGPAEGDDE